MDQDPLTHGASAPSSRSWQRLSLPYGLLYHLQHLVLFCHYAPAAQESLAQILLHSMANDYPSR